MARQINTIIVHCSDSQYGDAALIDSWHTARGWLRIGYHYVILNAYPKEANYIGKRPDPLADGQVEPGRHEDDVGAHVEGHNADSLGICLIGSRTFTSPQLLALRGMVVELLKKYPNAEVKGHYEFTDKKSCPNLNMGWLREWLVK